MLKKKATTLLWNLALSTCSAIAAWLYYSSIFMKGIGYPLSVSRLSKTQLKQLQAPITALSLNHLGYHKLVSRTVVFGTLLYSGLEFAPLDTTQGAGKIQLLLQHFRTPGQPHDVAIVIVDCFQYNAGVGFHILEDTQRKLSHLEGIWIPTVWAYLATIAKRSLQKAEATIQSFQRHGDQYIMDVVLASRLFKPREILTIVGVPPGTYIIRHVQCARQCTGNGNLRQVLISFSELFCPNGTITRPTKRSDMVSVETVFTLYYSRGMLGL
jgi:hypothetical protein